MKFSVDALDFRSALRGCAKAVAKDNYRPILQCVQIIADGGAVTLTALDGFRMVQYKLASVGEMESGEALVPPNLALIALHSVKENATVEINEGQMRVITDLAITVSIPNAQGEYIRHGEIWPDPKREQVRICVNPKFLVQAAQSLGVNNGMIYLEVPTNPIMPIVISSGNDTFGARGIVMVARARS